VPEQLGGRVALVAERDVGGRQRHHRRGAARQEYHEQIVLARSGGDLERGARRSHAARVGHGMRRRMPSHSGWRIRGRRRADANHLPQRGRRGRHECGQHRLGRLADGDDVNGRRRAQPGRQVCLRKRLPHEASSADSGQPGAHHGQEIVSDAIEGLCQ